MNQLRFPMSQIVNFLSRFKKADAGLVVETTTTGAPSTAPYFLLENHVDGRVKTSRLPLDATPDEIIDYLIDVNFLVVLVVLRQVVPDERRDVPVGQDSRASADDFLDRGRRS